MGGLRIVEELILEDSSEYSSDMYVLILPRIQVGESRLMTRTIRSL